MKVDTIRAKGRSWEIWWDPYSKEVYVNFIDPYRPFDGSREYAGKAYSEEEAIRVARDFI